MEEVFDPVLEITEYYDGPRKGVALLRGKPYRFSSCYYDAVEYQGDFESIDIFELVAVGADPHAQALLAHATFRMGMSGASAALHSEDYEVCWHVLA